MKNCFFSCLVFLALFSLGAGAQNREELWAQADKAIENNQPQTALKHLKAIEEAAEAEEAWGEAGKAFLLGLTQEHKPLGRKVDAARAADVKIAEAPEPMVPILRALSASLYYNYYQFNRWQILSRTDVALEEDEDAATWGLDRLLREIDGRFQEALKDKEVIQAVPIATFDGLLDEGELEPELRPTLYDFIAHQANEFYCLEETNGPKAVEPFEFALDSPAMGEVEAFLAWEPETGDSPMGRALAIYQDLLRFHQNDEDQRAFNHCDLERLDWAFNAANQGDDEEPFFAALRGFIEAHPEDASRARAQFILAGLHQSRDETEEAHRLYSSALQDFPEHPYGKLAGYQKEAMEQPSVQVQTESHWVNPDDFIRVEHRNTDRVWFRLYSVSFPQGNFDQESLSTLLKGRTPVLSWEQELLDKGDYRSQTTACLPPSEKPLPIGFHFLVASSREDLVWKDELVAYTPVHITKIAVSIRPSSTGGMEGFVMDALTGEPLPDIKVTATEYKRNERRSEELKSDGKGFFRFPTFKSHTHIVAQRGLERAFAKTYANSPYAGARNLESLAFLTDRAIYRPGQTIHFKGIYGRGNQKTAQYRVVANKELKVSLYDPNRKIVETLTLTTNENGSVSGSFTAPKGRNLGGYRLEAEGVRGRKYLRIEEYKRPKFYSEILPPENEAVLNQEVTVTARAEAYTGAVVDGAKVSWTVTRVVRWPGWFRWSPWGGHSSSSSEEIAHGEGETDAQGNFAISFLAKPDFDIPTEHEPVFDYEVSTSITDPSGETRSATRRISVAYTAYQAQIEVSDWNTTSNPVAVTLQTSSHQGTPFEAVGTLRIHKLKEPETCSRPENMSVTGAHRGGGDGVLPELFAPSAGADQILAQRELGELVGEFLLKTTVTEDQRAIVAIENELPAGAYRLSFEGTDSNGQKIRAFRQIEVHEPEADQFAIKLPFYTASPSRSCEVGEEFELLWGSGYDSARAVIEVYQNNQLLYREWTPEGATQHLFRYPVTEEQRGGFYVSVMQVNQNRFHQWSSRISVPWSNKKLALSWEHMVNKLEPGAKETWTALIEGPDGEAAAAEFVATLYDSSLDAFVGHQFAGLQSLFRSERGSLRNFTFCSQANALRSVCYYSSPDYYSLHRPYPHFLVDLGFNSHSQGISIRGSKAFFGRERGVARGLLLGAESNAFGEADSAPAAAMMAGEPSAKFEMKSKSRDGLLPPLGGEDNEELNDAPIPVRTNLQETAFFFPDLTTDSEGKVRLSFTMPEALTTWRFLGLAHDSELRFGLLDGTTVTALDLMIQPNPPRFLREGDELEFTAKITNQSEEAQSGIATLQLDNAATEKSRNEALGITSKDIAFEVPAMQSRTVSWRLKVPDGEEFLRYKVTAAADTLRDGEEGWLPVLSRKVLVTESMALPIRDAGSKDFQFKKLLASGEVESLDSRFLHLEVVSQPAWYAVMSLPYLMEFPHECAEQTFSRYYANALGAKIVNSDPKIKRVFELWKEGDALDSPLTKNEDLKSILLEETPWLAEAEDQSEARRRVALLFEQNKLDQELSKALNKLKKMQLSNGLWPWFPGGRGDDYITLQIVTGFARLRQLEVETDITPALRGLDALDSEMTNRYQELRKNDLLQRDNFSPWIAHYLYTRSLFLKDKALSAGAKPAFEYFTAQAKDYWNSLPSNLTRAQAALALHRLDENEVAKLIMRSLRENATLDEEMGMYWEQEAGWYWWQAPIETQAYLIEAFQQIEQDQKAVNDCRVWLIKQKQVSDWKTTKATTEAVASLLLGDSQLLSSSALLEVSLGGKAVEPGKVEPGTGFYQHRFTGEEVTPEQGQITLTKTDPGVSWASVHWQYLDSLENITSYDGKELQLEKELFVKRNTDAGKVLEPVTGPLEVGDELVTRLILRNDRAMEYVHLKDQRGSGTEPMNVLSGYRWQDGFGYYEMTKDTASHFFIDRLPVGTHVFETSVRIQHRGGYQTGLAEIRCMYAPEFAAHSASLKVEVK